MTASQRPDPGKPMPEFQKWKGRRILYCTEPNHSDTLNSGIMKDLTGGDNILYRLLFLNKTHEFKPQYKMHIMCNDTPKVDGSDKGVQRRIRKIDYISQFVDAALVNEEQHLYSRNNSIFSAFRGDPLLKMEFSRLLLENFSCDYDFDMPETISKNSREYLKEHDAVLQFVSDFVEPQKQGCFTLSLAKELFRRADYFNHKLSTFKRDLECALRCKCVGQSRVNGKNHRNVFFNFVLKEETFDIWLS